MPFGRKKTRTPAEIIKAANEQRRKEGQKKANKEAKNARGILPFTHGKQKALQPGKDGSIKVRMWRVTGSKLLISGGGMSTSLIQDSGQLKEAHPGSGKILPSQRDGADRKGWYLFAEELVEPLVLVGRKEELRKWLKDNSGVGIFNAIPNCLTVYMSVGKYTPGKRYKSYFPLHEVQARILDAVTGLGPGGHLAECAHGINGTTGSAMDFFKGLMKFKTSRKPDYSGLLRIDFGWLKRNGDVEIGRSRRGKFSTALNYLEGLIGPPLCSGRSRNKSVSASQWAQHNGHAASPSPSRSRSITMTASQWR